MHTGSIYSASWKLDSSQIVTCAAHKSRTRTRTRTRTLTRTLTLTLTLTLTPTLALTLTLTLTWSSVRAACSTCCHEPLAARALRRRTGEGVRGGASQGVHSSPPSPCSGVGSGPAGDSGAAP